MKKKTFYIKTLGCKVNQVESAFLIEKLEEYGFKLTSEQEAQIYILNSCTVTHKAEAEAKKIIKRWKNKFSPELIILTGCYPQVYYKEIYEWAKKNNINNLLILGQEDKFRITEILNTSFNLKEPVIKVTPIQEFTSCYPIILKRFYGHARAFVKVQDGCDQFCSYCIVPYTRGSPRSLPISLVLKQIDFYIKQGYKEIVLTGIHLGKWGKDFKPPQKFSELLLAIEDYLKTYNETFNLRLSSLEVKEIDEEFLVYIKESKFLVPHFHIPLQSGSNRILKLMNRHYTQEEYLETLEKLYKLFPHATFGADIIVGFPGETEEDFLETCKVVKNAPLNWLHIFPFSPRPGTKAEKMPDKIPANIIHERINILRKIIEEKRKEFLKSEIGKIRKVVLEKYDENKQAWKGLSENYINVLLKNITSETKFKGKIVKVKFIKQENSCLIGEVLDN